MITSGAADSHVTNFIQASLCKIQGLLKDFPYVFKDWNLWTLSHNIWKMCDISNEFLWGKGIKIYNFFTLCIPMGSSTLGWFMVYIVGSQVIISN